MPSSFTISARTPAGKQPGHAGEVDRRFGVARALEHATVPVAQREDVTGPGQVLGVRLRVDEGVDRGAAVGRGDAGRGAELRVDGDGERRPLLLAVLRPGDHQRQLQFVEARTLERQADDTARVADHERHLLRRHLLGRDDQVAFVLAILVVDDDDELAAPDGIDRSFDLFKGHGCSLLFGRATRPAPASNVPRTSQ